MPPVIVVEITWYDGQFARQETFGLWSGGTDDFAHFEAIAGFAKRWQEKTGIQPIAVKLALVQEPEAWLAAYEPPG